MTIASVVSTIGTIPLFSVRTFLPAFLTALFLKYPNIFPGIDEGATQIETSSFLANYWLLILLGVLSILEFVGDKITDVRLIMKEAEIYMRPASYLVVELGLLDQSASEVINQVHWASFNPMWLLVIFGTLCVYTLASIRKEFIEFLQDVDEDDNLFIGQFISWIEDSLVLFGFLLLIWAGITMTIIYGIIVITLIYWKKHNERKIEKQKSSCENCGEKILPFSINCFKCGKQQNKIFDIGILGQKKETLVFDVKDHQFNLLSHRRCSSCANKFESNSTQQVCKCCSKKLFSKSASEYFIKQLDKKFYKILFYSFLLGFIPVVGFIISAVMANIYLFSPYRKYISQKDNFLTKIFIRIVGLIFFIFGIAFGFLAAPAYCFMRYYIWKNEFKTALN